VKDYFLIAKINALFGRDGFIKIEPYSDFPERFFKLGKVFIDFWGNKKMFYVEKVKQTGVSFVLKFKNFNDDRDAGVLIGRRLFVDSEDVVKLPANNYFIHDLIGSKVIQGGEEIGEIADVLTAPANDVIVIKKNKNKEILIPLVLEFIERFDPEKKMLVLKKKISYEDED
jgi:16S rRNA processing protein RimM